LLTLFAVAAVAAPLTVKDGEVYDGDAPVDATDLAAKLGDTATASDIAALHADARRLRIIGIAAGSATMTVGVVLLGVGALEDFGAGLNNNLCHDVGSGQNCPPSTAGGAVAASGAGVLLLGAAAIGVPIGVSIGLDHHAEQPGHWWSDLDQRVNALNQKSAFVAPYVTPRGAGLYGRF